MQGPLSGRRVLELGTMIAAPFAAHILSQLGAEVIKIEPPAGDPTRSLVRGGPSGTFIAYNQSKKSVSMDLSKPDARAAFAKLLASTDIVLHNLSPKAARRLGVTYENCCRVRPDIIYCHIRGYGEGPLEDELASNPVAEASTGVMEANRINGRPSRLGPSYHDQFAGTYGVIGVLAALGQPSPSAATHKIEIGLYETGLHVAARDLAGVQLKTQLLGRPEREPNGEFSMPGYGAYETADGRWIYLLMLNDGHWAKFCQALALPEAADGSLTRLRDRKKQRDRVEALVKAAVGSVTYDKLAERLKSSAFGFTEVLPLEHVLDAPHAQAPGKLRRMDFRGYSFEVPSFPGAARYNHDFDLPPRELGEDTFAVLQSAGVTLEQCETMLRKGSIAVAAGQDCQWAPVHNAV